MPGGTKSKYLSMFAISYNLTAEHFSWDEWVPESRVLKYNEANVARQKEVQKAHSAQPNKSKKTTKKSTSSKTESVKDSDSRASTPVAEVGKGRILFNYIGFLK